MPTAIEYSQMRTFTASHIPSLTPQKSLKLSRGLGRVDCDMIPHPFEPQSLKCSLSFLESSYPLRLIPTKTASPLEQSLYMLSYGGGLVDGDVIELIVNVNQKAKLTIQTQGHTKVYKQSVESPLKQQQGVLARHGCTQHLSARIQKDGLLVLRPDPVSCFRNSTFRQIQTFDIQSGGSLLLLDLISSGRSSLGETWDMTSYFSENVISLDGERIVNDAWLLEDNGQSLKERMGPYHCFANLFLVGHRVQSYLDRIQYLYEASSTRRHETFDKHTSPSEPTLDSIAQQLVSLMNSKSLLWSLSPIRLPASLSSSEQSPPVMIRIATLNVVLMNQVLDWFGL